MSDQTGLLGKNDLLDRLAPSGAEDFITEVFCWILQQEDIGDAFLKFLEDTERDQRSNTKVADKFADIVSGIRKSKHSWSTQESRRISSGTKRPDMILKSEDKKQALIFEHKAWTPLGENQLANYSEIGRQYYNDGFAIILITARNYQNKQKPDLHFLWRDVYSWLEGWLNDWLSDNAPDADADISNLKFVCHNFLTLLRKRGLGPMKPITNCHFKAFKAKPIADEGMNRVKILVRAARDLWSQKMNETLNENPKMLEPCEFEDHWGRVGFRLLENSRPVVFIGILFDGKAHKVKLIGGDNGPDACVILGMHERDYPDYRENHHYKKLVERLTSQWPSNGSQKWRTDASSRNGWWPLHVRCKLADVLEDGMSGEEQVDAFLDAVREVVSFVDELDDFWELRKDQRHNKEANME